LFIKNMKRYLIIVLFSFSCGSVNAQQKTEFEFYEGAPKNVMETMQRNTKAVFDVIHDAYYSKKAGFQLSTDNVTPEAIGRLQALWSGSRFYCFKTDVFQPVLAMPNGKGWQARNIPVFFEQRETDDDKYQDLVIEFAPDGKISDVLIALSFYHESIMGMGKSVTDLRRCQLILGFLERFRSAYHTKDIQYIEMVFSSLLESKNKTQYLKNLKTAFANSQYINVKFSEIEVTQPYYEKDYYYCVTLQQEWNSANYSDKGWLFLIIDTRNDEKPFIFLSAWDPFDTPVKDRTGPDDFEL